MQFTSFLLAGAMAVVAMAQQPDPFTLTAAQYVGITAGKALNLTWTASSPGSVNLDLFQGNPSAFTTPLMSIVSNLPNNGYYLWTPSTSLVAGSDYAIRISSSTDSSQFNYTPVFSIASTVTVSASAASSSAASSSSASVASSSASTATGTTTSAASTGSTTSAASTSSAASRTTVVAMSTSTGGAIPTARVMTGGAMLGLVGAVMAAL